jgi:hypothetical protein
MVRCSSVSEVPVLLVACVHGLEATRNPGHKDPGDYGHREAVAADAYQPGGLLCRPTGSGIW